MNMSKFCRRDGVLRPRGASPSPSLLARHLHQPHAIFTPCGVFPCLTLLLLPPALPCT